MCVLVEEKGDSTEDRAYRRDDLLPFLSGEFLKREGGREGGREG